MSVVMCQLRGEIFRALKVSAVAVVRWRVRNCNEFLKAIKCVCSCLWGRKRDSKGDKSTHKVG